MLNLRKNAIAWVTVGSLYNLPNTTAITGSGADKCCVTMPWETSSKSCQRCLMWLRACSSVLVHANAHDFDRWKFKSFRARVAAALDSPCLFIHTFAAGRMPQPVLPPPLSKGGVKAAWAGTDTLEPFTLQCLRAPPEAILGFAPGLGVCSSSLPMCCVLAV